MSEKRDVLRWVTIWIVVCGNGNPHFASLEQEHAMDEMQYLDQGLGIPCSPHRTVDSPTLYTAKKERT